MPLTKPTTQDVAKLIPIRTITRGGGFEDDFTSNTRPTDVGTQAMIDKAHDRIFGKLGDPADWRVAADDVADYEGEATRLIELYSAMLVEIGFYSDQIKSGMSPYKELKELFDSGYNGMLEDLGLAGVSSTESNTRPAPPSYSFPFSSIGDGAMP